MIKKYTKDKPLIPKLLLYLAHVWWVLIILLWIFLSACGWMLSLGWWNFSWVDREYFWYHYVMARAIPIIWIPLIIYCVVKFLNFLRVGTRVSINPNSIEEDVTEPDTIKKDTIDQDIPKSDSITQATQTIVENKASLSVRISFLLLFIWLCAIWAVIFILANILTNLDVSLANAIPMDAISAIILIVLALIFLFGLACVWHALIAISCLTSKKKLLTTWIKIIILFLFFLFLYLHQND